jgi:hypothetical protein
MDCSVFTTENFSLLADQRVDQRRLADVRTPHDGDLDAVRGLLFVALFRLTGIRDFQRLVDHVRHAVAVRRRNGARVAETEFVEVRGDRAVLHPLGLVDDEENRPAGLAQIIGDRLVLRCETVTAVDDEHDDVRLLDRLARLARHLVEDAVFGDRLETAGVHDEVRTFAGPALAVVTIARQARQVGNERITRAREAVE